MAADLWIEIVGWERFQHYKDRRPTWIKLYPELLDDDGYRRLTIGEKLLLIELWMLYASSSARIQLALNSLSHRLDHRVTSEQIKSLSREGFIRISASKPLAHRYPRERDRERKKETKKEDNHRPVESSTKCPVCGATMKGPRPLAEHAYLQHNGPEPAHWLEAEKISG